MATSRQRAGAKKLDLGIIRQAMVDGRVWTGMGVVRVFEGETSHFQVDASSGSPDVIVDVELAPNGERLSCRLASPAGIWRIPPVGTEVAVIVPEGDFDADAIIVAELSSGAVPDGVAEDRVIILAPKAGGQVLVYDGNDPAEAVALATKQELQDLRDSVDDLTTKYNAHTHAVAGITAGTAAVTSAVVVDQAFPPTSPTGTTCLRAQ